MMRHAPQHQVTPLARKVTQTFNRHSIATSYLHVQGFWDFICTRQTVQGPYLCIFNGLRTASSHFHGFRNFISAPSWV